MATTIRAGGSLCTVIVTVDADPEVLPELQAHARDGLGRFATFPGFVSGALHRSADGGRMVQYLQWRTEADHLACMAHPGWDDLDSTRRFMELVNSGVARMDVRTYEVMATAEGGDV